MSKKNRACCGFGRLGICRGTTSAAWESLQVRLGVRHLGPRKERQECLQFPRNAAVNKALRSLNNGCATVLRLNFSCGEVFLQNYLLEGDSQQLPSRGYGRTTLGKVAPGKILSG